VSQPAGSLHRAFVGLGSNLGGPARQLRLALERLEDLDSVVVDGVSGLYRSQPLGGIEQPEFLNGVVDVRTALDPASLLLVLKGIEAALGRERTSVRWGPRRIDLDLLIFDDVRLNTPDLVIPHPGIGGRNFVLLPLRELAPDLAVPGLGRIAAWPVPDEPAIERISDSPWH
jgi:2-amino-4-hydroxy-6-hydroxymethyldihydropteridine diphosphokinase